jgi:hypothetical protein
MTAPVLVYSSDITLNLDTSLHVDYFLTEVNGLSILCLVFAGSRSSSSVMVVFQFFLQSKFTSSCIISLNLRVVRFSLSMASRSHMNSSAYLPVSQSLRNHEEVLALWRRS